jgi:acyl carrier protein
MIEAHEIEVELLAFLRSEVFAPEVSVTPETDLIAAGFESLSLVRLLVFVESTYGLWIPEAEINAVTLQNLRVLSTTIARLLHGE